MTDLPPRTSEADRAMTLVKAETRAAGKADDQTGYVDRRSGSKHQQPADGFPIADGKRPESATRAHDQKGGDYVYRL